MSESLCRDRGNEIINREHKDFPSPIAKGNRSLFLLSRNFWNLPNLPLQSLQGSWLPPGEEIRLLNGSFPVVFVMEIFRLAKIQERAAVVYSHAHTVVS